MLVTRKHAILHPIEQFPDLAVGLGNRPIGPYHVVGAADLLVDWQLCSEALARVCLGSAVAFHHEPRSRNRASRRCPSGNHFLARASSVMVFKPTSTRWRPPRRRERPSSNHSSGKNWRYSTCI